MVSGGGVESCTGLVGVPLGVDVSGLADAQCVQWAQDLEDLLHLGQALSVQIADELAQRVNAGRYAESGVRGPVDMLVQSLKVSASEAHRRLRLAHAVLPVRDVLSGEAAPVTQGALADAFFTGTLSTEMALLLSGFIDEAQRLAHSGQITAELADDVQDTLVESGREESPDFTRQLGNRIISHLDPDGHQPSRGDLLAKQGLFFRKPRRGLIHFDGHMTIAQHEQLMVAIGTATNPNKHKNINTINPTPPPETHPTTTTNTHGQTSTHSTTGTCGQSDTQNSDADQDALSEQLQGILGLFTTPPETPPTPLKNNTTHPTPAPAPRQAVFGGGQIDEGPVQARAGLPWRRRLAGWEIPPRPANAPPEATPPVFEGDQWFWLHTTTSNPHGWEPRGQNTDFNIWNTTPTPPQHHKPENNDPDQPQPSGQTPSGQGPDGKAPDGQQPDGQGPDSGDPARDQQVDDQIMEEQDWGERIINGIRVPFPGSGETLTTLDTTDPHNTDPVVKDDRTRAQQLLDGLLACVDLAARTGTLPLNGGLKTQLIITTTETDLERRDGRGTAFTTYNGPQPLNLFTEHLCDPEITTLTLGHGATILNAHRTQRLFTPTQRKILFARDLGCSFPNCTAIAPWTEAHHIKPWHHGGETNINNAALLCQHHHTLLHHSTWTATLINGTPHYTAPYLIDPHQTPRRNNYHHGLPNKPQMDSNAW